MQFKHITSILLVSGTLFMTGCGSDYSSNNCGCTEHQGENQSDIKSQFGNSFKDGKIVKDTTVKVGDKGTEVTLSEGTQFMDASGKVITTAPILHIKDGTIYFATSDGTKVIPTKSIVVTLPTDKKEGETVDVKTPNGTETVVVDKNGNVEVTVQPESFEKSNEIEVIIIDRSTNKQEN